MNTFIDKLPNKVYHGTKSIYKNSLKLGINLKKSEAELDFGRGFYTTTNYKQAIDFAKKHSKRNNMIAYRKNKKGIKAEFTNPMIVTYTIDKNVLKKLKIKLFKKADKDWAQFIFNNRLGIDYIVSDNHNLDIKYDCVYGLMADSDIAVLMEDIRLGNIKYDDFCNKIEPYDKFTQDQLSFHTENALKCLTLSDINIIKGGG